VSNANSLPSALFLQIGGSDQWGNITAGTDLIRKLMGGDSGEEAPQCFGLTFPLLVRGLCAGDPPTSINRTGRLLCSGVYCMLM
jgi:hypothetical protein